MRLTRRAFLRISARTAAALAAAPSIVSFAKQTGAAPEPATTNSREPLRQFDYSQVQLTTGPFAEQYNALHAHYLALDDDRLLKVYRQRAGLPAPGRDMGGWYDLNGFVPGHSLGQYISGLARFGASTGNTAAHDKVHTLVEGFAATLGPQNQSILRPDTNLWICYTLDKHLVGLVDAATLSNVSSAPDLLNRVLSGAQALLPAHGRDRIGKKDPPYDETFVMPENLFLAAGLTNNPQFTDLAHRYLLDRELFDPLARGDDPFPGQHAYSHAIALSSAARAYLVLGDPKYKSALEHAFTLLTTTQQFASGGWGPNETFITPHRGELHASLSTTVDHFETPCGSYAATKLARYLVRITAAPTSTQYADNLERVLFNAILAVRPPDSDGDYPYYSTYSADATRVFYSKKWPCCSGTLAQTVADYPLNIYLESHDGLYVNLYTPSRLRFAYFGHPVELEQETSFPASDTIALTLHSAPASAFTLYLRIPSWTTQSASLTINGKPLAIPAHPGAFAAIRRTWRSGDRIALTLPQTFRTEPIDDQNPTTVALMRGPLQYVALNPPNDFGNARLPLPSGLKQIAPQAFVEDYSGRQIVFVPLHQVGNQAYTSYFTTA